MLWSSSPTDIIYIQVVQRWPLLRKDNDIRKKIIGVLREHPEGLTILDVARFVGAHRHTITKYIYELVGAEVVQIRGISTAKVCFLKEKSAEKVREKRVLKKLKKRMR